MYICIYIYIYIHAYIYIYIHRYIYIYTYIYISTIDIGSELFWHRHMLNDDIISDDIIFVWYITIHRSSHGGFLKWGYPQIIPWLWNPPYITTVFPRKLSWISPGSIADCHYKLVGKSASTVWVVKKTSSVAITAGWLPVSFGISMTYSDIFDSIQNIKSNSF